MQRHLANAILKAPEQEEEQGSQWMAYGEGLSIWGCVCRRASLMI